VGGKANLRFAPVDFPLIKRFGGPKNITLGRNNPGSKFNHTRERSQNKHAKTWCMPLRAFFSYSGQNTRRAPAAVATAARKMFN
jgi:hypothetical protein